MANTKSLQKIVEYLKGQEGAVTPSTICKDNFLKWKAVKECVEILRQSNQILIFSSGKTTLIKFNHQKNAATN